MNIVFLIFDRITALDAIGPYEVLSRLPGAEVTFAGLARGTVRSDNRALGLVADVAIDEVNACDMLVVPGGFGERILERDARVLDWLRAMDSRSQITATVCTGALLLGATGLLRGRRASTHWACRDRLAQQGALVVPERVVRDGKYASAAGVSAGIDLALSLALELHGHDVAASIQLSIEYDPRPPLDGGNAETAAPSLRDPIQARIRARDAELAASLGG
jgi:transcriptional regulator GlxA family with amidase domain